MAGSCAKSGRWREVMELLGQVDSMSQWWGVFLPKKGKEFTEFTRKKWLIGISWGKTWKKTMVVLSKISSAQPLVQAPIWEPVACGAAMRSCVHAAWMQCSWCLLRSMRHHFGIFWACQTLSVVSKVLRDQYAWICTFVCVCACTQESSCWGESQAGDVCFFIVYYIQIYIYMHTCLGILRSRSCYLKPVRNWLDPSSTWWKRKVERSIPRRKQIKINRQWFGAFKNIWDLWVYVLFSPLP